MTATDDYLTSIQADRSLTNEQKNLLSQHIPKFLIATTQTSSTQADLLADAAKLRSGTKK